MYIYIFLKIKFFCKLYLGGHQVTYNSFQGVFKKKENQGYPNFSFQKCYLCVNEPQNYLKILFSWNKTNLECLYLVLQGGVNWYHQLFWPSANIFYLGQQRALNTKTILGTLKHWKFLNYDMDSRYAPSLLICAICVNQFGGWISHCSQPCPWLFVAIDFVLILAIFHYILWQISSGEDQSRTTFFWSCKIGTRLDRFLRELKDWYMLICLRLSDSQKPEATGFF